MYPIIGGRNLLARVDHKNILGTALREHVPRRLRMATFNSEHDATIVHVPGKSKMHSLADDLSRSPTLMSPVPTSIL